MFSIAFTASFVKGARKDANKFALDFGCVVPYTETTTTGKER